MKNYFLPIGLSLIFLLSSCMTTGFKDFYQPWVVDLSQADKDFYKQNIGCLIYIVYNSSPAYFSNLVYGDIITRITIKIFILPMIFWSYKKCQNMVIFGI